MRPSFRPTPTPPLKGRGKIIAAALALTLLAACGKKGDLAYGPGQKVPPIPLGATASPTPQQLLKSPTQAKPDRVDDPVTKSGPREADRFDLPPPR